MAGLREGTALITTIVDGFSNQAHIHVQRDRMLAKFWLDLVSLAGSTRFSARDLRKVEGLVVENRELLMERWNEYFSS